ncbi:hypothetical protein CPC08DRAFT_717253 [Agrocybe pediades]|nr:hypothetical protein CPC08DRAFT_717253 [Agrocybe pediades]
MPFLAVGQLSNRGSLSLSFLLQSEVLARKLQIKASATGLSITCVFTLGRGAWTSRRRLGMQQLSNAAPRTFYEVLTVGMLDLRYLASHSSLSHHCLEYTLPQFLPSLFSLMPPSC